MTRQLIALFTAFFLFVSQATSGIFWFQPALTTVGGGSPPAYVSKCDGTLDTDGGSTYTISSCTTGSVTNGYMVIGCSSYAGGPNNAAISSGTYGAQSITPLLGGTESPTGEMFAMAAGLAGPSAQTANISITLNASLTEVVCSALVYSGVHQTTSTGTAVTSSAASNCTVDASSATTETVVDVLSKWDGTTPTEGASQAARTAIENGADSTDLAMSDETGAATTTMSWTNTGACSIVAVPLKPA